VSSVIPKAPRPPSIRYVDQDAPTIPLRGLDEARARAILSRIDTLMPIAAEVDDSDADITLRVTTKRELRVRAIGRRVVVVALVAAVALLLASALRPRSATHVLGAERQAKRRDVGVLVVPSAPDVVIFDDDGRAGVAPEPIEVTCGARRVRIGEHGSTRTVDVPCEGRVEL